LSAYPPRQVRSDQPQQGISRPYRSLLGVAQDRFDVFVTVDRRLEKQNKLSEFKLGFVIAHVPNNRSDAFEPIFKLLNEAAEKVRPGEVIHVVGRDK
jgi:hypothetical protein